MKAEGRVFRYGDNVDTDVIIPARYLNTSDKKELASHCMEDIDSSFVKNVQRGDIIVAGKNFGSDCDQGGRCKLCHSYDIRAHFLPQLNQYRIADSGVPRGFRGNQSGGQGLC